MPNYAIIENGVVVNVVVSDDVYAAERGWKPCTDGVGIGWDYTGGQFVDNRPAPAPVEAAPAPTKEQMLAELQALTAKIQALE